MMLLIFLLAKNSVHSNITLIEERQVVVKLVFVLQIRKKSPLDPSALFNAQILSPWVLTYNLPVSFKLQYVIGELWHVCRQKMSVHCPLTEIILVWVLDWIEAVKQAGKNALYVTTRFAN